MKEMIIPDYDRPDVVCKSCNTPIKDDRWIRIGRKHYHDICSKTLLGVSPEEIDVMIIEHPEPMDIKWALVNQWIMKIRPKSKMRARTVHKGNRTWTYTPTSTVDYENYLKTLWKEFIGEKQRPLFTIDVPIRIDILFHIKGHAKLDTDNARKAIWDSMNKLLFEDDDSVLDDHVWKRRGYQDWHTVINLYVPEEILAKMNPQPINT
jgi:Holliday junction resolvase RusA-like endonuclease